jgi:NADH dehydrogenase
VKQIVILGAGYGGVLSALKAREQLTPQEAAITVITRESTHQIMTELHRLAAGNIEERTIALPLSTLFKGKHINVVIDQVDRVDVKARQITTGSGTNYIYDYVVLALGSETNYFGIPGLKEHSLTLKSADEANKIYNHIHARLDAYKKTHDPADATIVIGGGGLTGVELAGELVDELPAICSRKGINYSDLQIYLVEAMPTILPMLSAELVERAMASLSARGLQFLTSLPITSADAETVSLKNGQVIKTHTCIWTGGVQGSHLVAESGVECNRGRATVNEYLQSVSHPEVFCAGDCAVVMGEDGRPYPPTAQIANQMGDRVGANLAAHLHGYGMNKFDYYNSGTLCSLGRTDCVGAVGENAIALRGLPAAIMKSASNTRYLTHIKGLFALAY